MIYNYQQQVQMEAFRRGLSLAYQESHSSFAPSSLLILVQDSQFPDPRDRFGIGDRASIQGDADVVWTNELQLETEYGDASRLPTIHYKFNPNSSSSIDKTYTLAGYEQYDFPPGFIEVNVLGEEYEITQEQTKVYIPEGSENKQVKILIIPEGRDMAYCNSHYCPTDIITSADVDNDRKKDEEIVEAMGVEHQPVDGFRVVDFQNGEIDTDYFSLGSSVGRDATDELIYVTPETMQGLLIDRSVQTQRRDKLTLEEQSGVGGYWKSTDNLNTATQITHKIRTNNPGAPPEIISCNLTIDGTRTWETSK